MRRLSRIDKSIGFLQRQGCSRAPSPYLCLACKLQTVSFSTSSIRAAPPTDKTEKIRQKLWGTDKPPGLADPYGGESILDKIKKPKPKIETREREPEEAPMEVEETVVEVEQNETNDDTPLGRATTWDGLKRVGGGPVWQPEVDFEGFLPADAATEPGEIIASLHRAVVEVFALKQAGKPLHELSTLFPEIDIFRDWTDDVQIAPSSGGATIQMPKNTSLQEVIGFLATPEAIDRVPEAEPTESQEDVEADRSAVDPLKLEDTSSSEHGPEQARRTESEDYRTADHTLGGSLVVKTFNDVISSWDPSWLQISLENPRIKFAVLKRTMQLTGIQIPDAAIKSSDTPQALLNILVTPPKPRKLFEALSQKSDLAQLENVSIYPKRRLFSDRERDIGRLKVINEALEERQLKLLED